MGLKGYRLWVMGQLHSNVQRPTEFITSGHLQCGAVGAMSSREVGAMR
jgi:hypothetical protein